MHLTVTAGPQGSWLRIWIHLTHDVGMGTDGTYQIKYLILIMCKQLYFITVYLLNDNHY